MASVSTARWGGSRGLQSARMQSTDTSGLTAPSRVAINMHKCHLVSWSGVHCLASPQNWGRLESLHLPPSAQPFHAVFFSHKSTFQTQPFKPSSVGKKHDCAHDFSTRQAEMYCWLRPEAPPSHHVPTLVFSQGLLDPLILLGKGRYPRASPFYSAVLASFFSSSGPPLSTPSSSKLRRTPGWKCRLTFSGLQTCSECRGFLRSRGDFMHHQYGPWGHTYSIARNDTFVGSFAFVSWPDWRLLSHYMLAAL